jgi:exonuclease SbcD
MSLKILHFADAHIDIANYGRQDAESGLPLRVLDFLKSLDEIVDAAINQKVDLVIFAGDAYKDRTPAPTFQREWDKRIMRLSNAGIPTILLVGNHDVSPRLGRASALEEFISLEVPNVHIIDQPTLLTPDDLNGLPLQVMALPWVYRSGMLAYLDMKVSSDQEIAGAMEERIREMLQDWVDKLDPDLPAIFTAHTTVQGAEYGSERTVMLGRDLVLAPSLLKNLPVEYIALGHIHKAQDLNEGQQPPIIYAGSIERVDFGEAGDQKYYLLAEIEKGKDTRVTWNELKHIRRFHDRRVTLESDQDVTGQLQKALPAPDEMADAIVRLTVTYPRDWETLIDEAALREMAAEAFEFRLVKRPQVETRVRIPEGRAVGSMSAEELLEIYWQSAHVDEEEQAELVKLAQQVIRRVNQGEE